MIERVSQRELRLAAQSVLYETSSSAHNRMLIATDRAATSLLEQYPSASVTVRLGDCSPIPCLSDHDVSRLAGSLSTIHLEYQNFGANLGHGAAQNRLAAQQTADYILMMNPDVVLHSDALRQLFTVIESDPTIGIVDGKQLPLEHPKRYDPVTGDTSWCSGALSLVRGEAFRAVGGFDSDAFFMHGDDVDLSWRIRNAGWRAVHHPGAIGFHDRRLTHTAAMAPSPVEQYHSAESALMLAHVWGAAERLEKLRREYRTSHDEVKRQSLAGFEKKLTSGNLRTPETQQPSVATFDGDTYGGHRW